MNGKSNYPAAEFVYLISFRLFKTDLKKKLHENPFSVNGNHGSIFKERKGEGLRMQGKLIKTDVSQSVNKLLFC